MVRGTTKNTLLDISKSSTKGWENSTVFIGNQPAGYKVSKTLFTQRSKYMISVGEISKVNPKSLAKCTF